MPRCVSLISLRRLSRVFLRNSGASKGFVLPRISKMMSSASFHLYPPLGSDRSSQGIRECGGIWYLLCYDTAGQGDKNNRGRRWQEDEVNREHTEERLDAADGQPGKAA